MANDTIFAVASGAGRAAIAILRISGPQTHAAVTALAGRVPDPRVAIVRRLRHPVTAATLDRGLVLWFPGPHSFTGEDSAELHLHGGRAVIDAVLGALADLPRLRLAEAGEFTRRAFLNGKMDLAEVEGLADLIDAQTEAQRRQALRQMEGALGLWVAAQRQRLLQALAAAESAIDFVDEGDVAGDLAGEVRRHVGDLAAAIAQQQARAGAAARIRDGLVVVIAGPPNVGKSTLMNALARRDVAIVSSHAGTTRDLIEVDLDLDGYLVTLVDTAGLRDTDDPIEQEGIARARRKGATADLVLWLTEAGAPLPPDAALAAVPLWRIGTKSDLAAGPTDAVDALVAAPTGQGLDELVGAIRSFAASDAGGGEDGIATRLRHRRALADACAALDLVKHAGPEVGLEIVSEQLRLAARRLDSLVGRIDNEDILGEIFGRFCIGK